MFELAKCCYRITDITWGCLVQKSIVCFIECFIAFMETPWGVAIILKRHWVWVRKPQVLLLVLQVYKKLDFWLWAFPREDFFEYLSSEHYLGVLKWLLLGCYHSFCFLGFFPANSRVICAETTVLYNKFNSYLWLVIFWWWWVLTSYKLRTTVLDCSKKAALTVRNKWHSEVIPQSNICP